MNIKAPEGMSSAERIAFYDCEENRKYYQYGTAGGWKKYGKNPVFGGDYGTCFDVSLLLEEGKEGMPVFKMWFSLGESVCSIGAVAWVFLGGG